MNTNQNKTNKIAKNAGQQGDVCFKRVTELPEGERIPISKKNLRLAEGERTGHYHGIVEDNSEMFKIGDRTFMYLAEDATLTHQEHKHITVEKGLWEIGIVQEYDYFSKMVKPVVD